MTRDPAAGRGRKTPGTQSRRRSSGSPVAHLLLASLLLFVLPVPWSRLRSARACGESRHQRAAAAPGHHQLLANGATSRTPSAAAAEEEARVQHATNVVPSEDGEAAQEQDSQGAGPAAQHPAVQHHPHRQQSARLLVTDEDAPVVQGVQPQDQEHQEHLGFTCGHSRVQQQQEALLKDFMAFRRQALSATQQPSTARTPTADAGAGSSRSTGADREDGGQSHIGDSGRSRRRRAQSGLLNPTLRVVLIDQLSATLPAAAASAALATMEVAARVIKKFVQVVEPATSPIMTRPQLTTCGTATIPAWMTVGSGVGVASADLVIIVTSNLGSSACDGNVVAVCLACDFSITTGRPTVANINLCLGAFGGNLTAWRSSPSSSASSAPAPGPAGNTTNSVVRQRGGGGGSVTAGSLQPAGNSTSATTPSPPSAPRTAAPNTTAASNGGSNGGTSSTTSGRRLVARGGAGGVILPLQQPPGASEPGGRGTPPAAAPAADAADADAPAQADTARRRRVRRVWHAVDHSSSHPDQQPQQQPQQGVEGQAAPGRSLQASKRPPPAPPAPKAKAPSTAKSPPPPRRAPPPPKAKAPPPRRPPPPPPLVVTSSTRTLGSSVLDAVVHEMVHALGFLSTLYGQYLSDDGTPLGPGGALVNQTDPGNAARQVSFMATQRVTEEAKRYLGCDSLPGAQLENEGSAAQALQHWEFRLFFQDLMTPLLLQGLRARMTGLTLGLLEDTGWYAPRWDYVQPFAGRPPSGCDLPTAACSDYQSRNPGQFYCQAGSPDRRTCLTPTLPLACGAANAFSDGCRVQRPAPLACSDAAGALATGAATAATVPGHAYLGFAGMFGPSARCLPWSADRYTRRGGCFLVACSGTSGTALEVSAGSGASSLQRCGVGGALEATDSSVLQQLPGAEVECPADAAAAAALCASLPVGTGGAAGAAGDACGGACVNGECLPSGRCACALEWMGGRCSVHVRDVADFDNPPA